jgi:alkylhydroperoxidase family enzyme
VAHLKPLPPDSSPGLAEDFAIFERILGFVPNSLLTMQRVPAMVRGFGELTRAVMDPAGTVDLGFMRLIAHFASRAAGCQYCEAHSLVAAEIHGISREKLAALWEYQKSPLYSEAEKAALDFALAAGSVPNAVDEALMARMKAHWTEDQIVRILGASMATDLEEAPRKMGEEVLARGGWTGGKHL